MKGRRKYCFILAMQYKVWGCNLSKTAKIHKPNDLSTPKGLLHAFVVGFAEKFIICWSTFTTRVALKGCAGRGGDYEELGCW